MRRANCGGFLLMLSAAGYSLPDLTALRLHEELLDLFWIGRDAALGCLAEDSLEISRTLLGRSALALSVDILLLSDGRSREEYGGEEGLAAKHHIICYKLFI